MTTKTKNQIKHNAYAILIGGLMILASYTFVVVFHYGIAPIFDKLLGK